MERDEIVTTDVVEEAPLLDRLVKWLAARDKAEIGIAELYRLGPAILNADSLDIEQALVAGLDTRRLALVGLANVVRVRDSTA